MAKMLLQRLKLDEWPFELRDLPEGTVLVGGAIRDALLTSQVIVSDLDFVVPNQAIQTSKILEQKYGGKAVILDAKRDIARYVYKNWTIDLASQIGKHLKDDSVS